MGVVCLAAPITNAAGEVIAAVAMQAPRARMSLREAQRHLPRLKRAAQRYSEVFNGELADRRTTEAE